MWYCALITALVVQSTICLPQYDLANKDVYEIREDKDTNSVQFVNPKSPEPLLREITYYHVIERAHDGAVQTDKILGSYNDNDGSTEGLSTNAHNHQFHIDMLHHDDQNSDQAVENNDQAAGGLGQMSDQVTEGPHEGLLEQLSRNWFLNPLLQTTEKPSQTWDSISQQFDQTQPSIVPVDTKPSPTFDQTLSSMMQQHDWFRPAVTAEQAEPTQPTADRHNWFNRLSSEIVNPVIQPEVNTEEVENIQAVETTGLESNNGAGLDNLSTEYPEIITEVIVKNKPEVKQEDIVEDPLITPEVVETPAAENLNSETSEAEIVQTEINLEDGAIAEEPLTEIVEPNSKTVIVKSESEPEEVILNEPEIIASENLEPENLDVVSDPELVETEGDFEIIEDPILTAAIIEAEGKNPGEMAAEEEINDEVVIEEGETDGAAETLGEGEVAIPEVETAEEAIEDTQAQNIEQSERFYQLYESPAVLRDRYMKLRRYMPKMALREPEITSVQSTEQNLRRKRRSAMQPEEDPEYIPEAPVLPPLNYDSLPDYIRTAISTAAPNEEEVERQKEEPSNTEDKMVDLFKQVQKETGLDRKEVEEGLEKSEGVVNMETGKVRTYGMKLNGDHGFIWNDMFSNPGMAYNVGEDGGIVEGHKEEQKPEILTEIEGHTETEKNEDSETEKEGHPEADKIENSETENEGHPEADKIEDIKPEKPDGHHEDLEPNTNSEQATDAVEDMEDIFVNIDKEKNKRPPHYLVKPEPGDAVSVRKEEPKDETGDIAAIGDLIKTKQFWTWLSDWTSSYVDLFTDKFATVMREEIAKIPGVGGASAVGSADVIIDEKPTIDMSSENIEPAHTTEDDITDENMEDKHTKTIFINGKEIALTRTSNLDEEPKSDDISDDMLKKRQNNNKDNGKEQVKVISKAIYGNTIGNEKVTNIYIFFPEHDNNKLLESLKPLQGTKDEVKVEENKEISIEENASSTTEDSDITKTEEPSSIDNTEQVEEPQNVAEPNIAKEPEILEEPADANTELIEASKDKTDPTTETIVKEDSLEHSINAESPIESSVATPDTIEDNKEEILLTTESKVPVNSDADKLVDKITEISTQPSIEESSNPIEEEATTEGPKISDVNPESTPPIILVTEEPKTSMPIVEAVTPFESNSKSTIAPEEERQSEESVNKEDKSSVTAPSENVIPSETTEVNKLTNASVAIEAASENSSIPPAIEPLKEDTIESSSERPPGELNVASEAKPAEDSPTSTPEETLKQEEKVEPSSEVPPSDITDNSEIKDNAEGNDASTSALEEKPAEVVAST